MSPEAWYVLAVLLGSLVLLLTDRVGIDVVGIGMLAALLLGGILGPTEALVGFANPALATIALLFVVCEGLVRTGAIERWGRLLLRAADGSRTRLVVVSLFSVAFLSAFVNNTPIVVLFVPLMLGLSERFDLAPSKILIPVSFASILGGTCTLIGTSTNLAIDGWIEANEATVGIRPFHMFEFSLFGVIYATVGITYLILVAPRLLPERPSITSTIGGHRHREYLTELRVPPESAWIGRPVRDLVEGRENLRVLQHLRGDEVIWPPFAKTRIRADDVFLVKGDAGEVLNLLRSEGLGGASLQTRPTEIALAEVVILPGSSWVGRTLRAVHFARETNCHVIALQRHERHLRDRLSRLPLAAGDLLLVEGEPQHIEALPRFSHFLTIVGDAKEHVVVNRWRARLAIGVVAAIVVGASLQLHPAVDILGLSMAGFCVLLATGTLPARRAYSAVQWPILALIGGMIGMAGAMTKTGVDATLAGLISATLQGHHPHLGLLIVFLATSLLSQVINNAAAAVLMMSISVQVASGLGVSPMPFVMGVLFGASACFATPFGYQTNLIVFGPGGYRTTDYLRVGLPLNLLLTVVATLLIPVFWPF